MHLKLNYFTIASITMICFNSFAQKFGNPILGAGRSVMYTKLEGLLGNKEIRKNGVGNGLQSDLLIYEDGKQLKKEKIVIHFNGEKYNPNGYFVNDDRIVGYFMSKSVSYFQEFDLNLKPIGTPIEILAVNFIESKNQSVSPVVKVDKETGTILLIYIYSDKDTGLANLKTLLVDKNYRVLNSFEHVAKNKENQLKVVPFKIYDNNDYLISISEGKSEFVGNNNIFNIVEQFLIYVLNDGNSNELELNPDYQHIMTTVVADNFDSKGNSIYAIQSYNKNAGNNIIALSIYSYNSKQGELDRNTVSINVNDFFGKYNSESFRLKQITNLSDGSMLLWLEMNYGRTGDFVIKLDKNLDLVWSANTNPRGAGYAEFTSSFNYFDESENFVIIFNCLPKLFKDGTMIKRESSIIMKSDYVNLGSFPAKATIDINTGQVNYELINTGKHKLGGIKMDDLIKVENGKFILHMMIDKKLQFVEVDFNEN